MYMQQSPRQLARGRLRTARVDLLIVIIFTVVNIAMIFAESQSVMLFSAVIPYYAVAIAYSADLAFGGLSWLIQGSLILAAVILAMYFVCWLLSKKHYGWLIGAAVLFGVDTVGVLLLYGVVIGDWSAGVMDILLHGLLLYYLIMGAVSGHRLKTLPETVVETVAPPPESLPLRAAEPVTPEQIILQSEAAGLLICYCRDEELHMLIINGYVYDEVKTMVETNHELRAVCGGHTVVAGFHAGAAGSYILFDGQPLVHLPRWN